MFSKLFLVSTLFWLLYWNTESGTIARICKFLSKSKVGKYTANVITWLIKFLCHLFNSVVILLLIVVFVLFLQQINDNRLISQLENDNLKLQNELCMVVYPYVLEELNNSTLEYKIDSMQDLINYVNQNQELCSKDGVLENIENYLVNSASIDEHTAAFKEKEKMINILCQ